MSRFSSEKEKTAVWCVYVCVCVCVRARARKLSLAFNMTVTATPVTHALNPLATLDISPY